MHHPAAPLDLLRRAFPELPPRLQAAGHFLAGHEYDATTRSMRGLAAAAGVNPANFTRLAQALGYPGWDSLRESLIETRRTAVEAPFSGRVRIPRPGDKADSGRTAAELVEADAASLQRMQPGASAAAAAAAALHGAERAWIAGFRSCQAIAALLHYQLRLFRPDNVRLVGSSGPEDLDLGAFQAGDAVVVISFAPYSRAAVGTARAARAAGCVLIALTDAADAPVAAGADHLVLFGTAGGPGFYPSLTAALSLAQALAAAAFVLGGQAALTRLRETEARLATHLQLLPAPGQAP